MTPTPSPAFLRGPVSTLQEMLRTISHVDRAIPFLRPTGIFDEDTLAAVMTFQKVHGRPVTGVVDQQNWNAIQMAYLQAAQQLTPPRPVTLFSQGAAPIHPGQRHASLVHVQGMFRALAQVLDEVIPTPATGVLDQDSTANLRWVQRHANLPQTGILDGNTWETLVRLFETFVTQTPQQVISGSA